MTQLFGPVCSITTTKRRRFFWAAWWTAPPKRSPFVKPDASDGGAATFEEALAAAEKRAGTSLRVIEPLWARAWIRMLRGQHPWPNGARSAESPPQAAEERATTAESIWATLGVSQDVSAEDLKLAFRRRALETHPDQGGDPETFRRVLRAYAEAQRRLRKPRRRARQ